MNDFSVFGYASGPPAVNQVGNDYVANIRIGEPRTRRHNGQDVSFMENFDGALWGEQRAMTMAQMVETGDEVYLKGELGVRRYTHENRERFALEIRIDKWRIVSKKADREAGRAARQANAAAQREANGAPPANGRAAEPSSQSGETTQGPPPANDASAGEPAALPEATDEPFT